MPFNEFQEGEKRLDILCYNLMLTFHGNGISVFRFISKQSYVFVCAAMLHTITS
jgi:hypothetical protein